MCPSNKSTPGTAGSFGCEKKPKFTITYFARTASFRSVPMTQRCAVSSQRISVTAVPKTPFS